MKLFSYKVRNFTSIGVKYGKKIFDFNKAYNYFKNSTNKGFIKFVSLEELIVKGLCSQNFLAKIVNYVKRNDLWSMCKIGNYRYLPVITKPEKFLGIGKNYVAHASETGSDVPEEPMIFLKAPSSISAHLDDIVIPKFDVGRIDHEAELAVVIGKKGKDILKEQAMDYVAGYTIVNDVTAREIQKKDMSRGFPWMKSKSIDTFGPIGPYFVPKDFIKNPYNLKLSCKVNGEIRQDGNTGNMVYKIDDLISYISMYMTLKPNDIITTGTVSGISEIKAGDIVECIVEEIGTLRNKVVGN